MYRYELQEYLNKNLYTIGKECGENEAEVCQEIMEDGEDLPENIIYLSSKEKFYDISDCNTDLIKLLLIETSKNNEISKAANKQRELSNSNLITIRKIAVYFCILSVLAIIGTIVAMVKYNELIASLSHIMR